MFYVFFRGLGFLAPAAMGGPFILTYIFLEMQPETTTATWLKFMGIAAIISPIFAYGVGKYLNRNGIGHSLAGIRFEHWGIMEGVIVGKVVSNRSFPSSVTF